MAFCCRANYRFEHVRAPSKNVFRLDQETDWFPVHFKRDEAEGYDHLLPLLWIQVFIVDEPFLGLDPLTFQFDSTSRSRKKRKTVHSHSTHVP